MERKGAPIHEGGTYGNEDRDRKFGLLDKLAYGAGDFGCNMSFALKGTMTLFWTQFMGIDTIVMAGLTLIT